MGSRSKGSHTRHVPLSVLQPLRPMGQSAMGQWLTFLWCVSVASVLPMRRSHSRTVLSWLAVITCSRVAENMAAGCDERTCL